MTAAAGAAPLGVLVFVGTEGVYHDHPGTGRLLRELLAAEPGVEAKLAQDYEILAGGLERFHTILLYTDVGSLSPAQEAGLLAYVRGGGGCFGLHTASASFRANAGYHDMLNGMFDGHSPYMEFTVTVTDRHHPITRGLEAFTVHDELHYFAHDPARSQRLMEAYDPTTGATYAMALHHRYGAGRVFYFALGHDAGSHHHPTFRTVIRRGVHWTGGRC